MPGTNNKSEIESLDIGPSTEDPLFVFPAIQGTGFDSMLERIMPARSISVERPSERQPFKWRTELTMGGGINMLHARYSSSFSYSPEQPDDSLILRFCGAGAAKATIRGKEYLSSEGTAIVASWSDVVRTVVMPDDRSGNPAASTFMGIGPAMVNDCLQDMFPGIGLKQLKLAPLMDLGTQTGRLLVSMCGSLNQGLKGERFLARSPKAMALLSEAIVRFILEQADHQFNDADRIRTSSIVPRHVKKAMEFMHANMHLPLKLTDIAEVAGVSTRSLQIGFNEFRETTPLAYLRQIRLQAAYAELSAEDNALSVQEVALKWGFSHMGRFAAQYKAAFGESPSATARLAHGLQLGAV